MAARTLLRLVDVRKAFAGVQALRGVSFDLLAGEVHALVGENGAGKSTLVRVITGAHRPDSGTIEFDGAVVADLDPVRSKALGVAAIYQQPALFPELTVAENVAIGLEPRGGWRVVDWKARRDRARRLLELVGSTIDPQAEAKTLTMPEQQLVEIARALGSDARIVIMDEPTASLSEREVDNLFRVIAGLKARGAGVIYISHRLEELPRVADRVTALRDGALVGTRATAEIDRAGLIRMMVGRDLSTLFPKHETSVGEMVLEVSKLGCRASGVKDVSLAVRAGEIVGLAGLVGAGRTELARVLFGLTPADSGTIAVRGRAVTIKGPGEAVAHGIAYVPEDRPRHGVIAAMSVAANASLATLRRVSRLGIIDRRAERAAADRFVEALGIKAASVDDAAATLSGGNQQKVALARWLATEPAVLILDEPTQGVDVGAKREIHRIMGELAAKGMAILLISSELPEILAMSDRIVVMHAGAVTGELSRGEATEEAVVELALGRVAAGAAS